MLSNIIKQSDGWDTKALAKIFSNKKFLKSVDGDKEKYLADLISKDYEKRNITLPREIIPNDVTLSALCYIYKKEPATLPILLRYFTHSNLLAEAKDDLDKLNQKLQGVMDKDLKDLQDKKAKLQADRTNLNNVEMHSEKAKALAIGKRAKKIIMLKDLQRIASILSLVTLVVTAVICIIGRTDNTFRRAGFVKSPTFSTYEVYVVIGVSVAAILLAIAGVAYLTRCHLEHSFAKETQNFIEGPKHVDKATNAENVEESKQQEEKWTGEDLIDLSYNNDECNNQVTPSAPPFEEEVKWKGKDLINLSGNCKMNYEVEPSAPPYDEPKQPGLYPDLSEAQPPSYEEACGTIVQLEDSGPSSNLDSAEQLKPGTDLLGSLSEQQNAKLGPVLLPSNTM